VNEDAPVMPYGYVTMLLAAVIPPVWLRLTDPLLADWDNRFASTEERNLIAKSQ
jgi:alkane 1-monooxygenase